MAHTRAPAGATDPAVSGDGGRARRLAKLSLWMLVVFAAWTVVYIFLAGPVAESFGVGTGAQGYIEAWLPWIAVSLLWVAPLLAGAVLGGRALALGAGRLAWIGLAANGVALLFFIVPSVVDRLTHL